MKHKVTTTAKGQKIIVDKSAKIFVNDYYDNNGNILKCDEIKIRTGCNKIMFTINFSIDKNIPMIIVEDEVEELAEHYSEVQEGTYTPQHKIIYKHGFIDGHNVTQQRGIYSEEDLNKAFQCGQQWVHDINHDVEPENFNQFIQSLKQEYIELETEEKQHFEKDITKRVNPLNGVFYETRIKTNRDKSGQLIAYQKS